MDLSKYTRSNMFDFRRNTNAQQQQPAQQAESSGPPTLASVGTVPTARVPLEGRRRGHAVVGPGPPPRREMAEEAGSSGEGNQDSITLGQLKAHQIVVPEKQKKIQFDYRYDDTDTLMAELEEFYPYVELPQVTESVNTFRKVFQDDWTETSHSKRRDFIELQLEYLESPVYDRRRSAQQSLLYLLHGCFGDTTSCEMQLHWVMENAKTLRSLDGVASLVIALRDASWRYNSSHESHDRPPAASPGLDTSAQPVDPYDDRSAELMDIIAMLYFVVEVFRTDDTFGDELMAISPPLPLLLFQMVSSLKDRLPKGYPVKKVLLLLWKTLLACLGGMKEINQARTLSRELAGLPKLDKNFTKSSPMDIATWRRDTSVKYPTFAPAPSNSVSIPNEQLADGIKPIPTRPNYHSTEIAPSSPRKSTSNVPPPQTATPAPTPPASPLVKPKKMQFQTDPSRPFILPYSRLPGPSTTPASLVPYAIDEADKLYHRHAYVSTGLYQLWEVREECMREERGLGRKGLIGFDRLNLDDEEDDEDALEAKRREWRYEEEEMDCADRGDKTGARAAREKKLSSRRLHRVDIIYKNTLPHMQSCVIVLLKLLLATVTSPTGGPGAQVSGGMQSPTSEVPPEAENAPPPTREEVDVARHREITSKAVSAILVLMLKWFKASHILKFHYFAQLLFDSNCLLLVLKMFGLSDVFQTVQTRHEVDDWNFFEYCRLNCSKVAGNAPPIRKPENQPQITHEGELEIETRFNYSWRNFFSTINFLKILQKMTKHRSHRTYMLQMYKSSQILKRMLKIHQPMMQLQVLKLIKSQMPWCGRKWRQTNMKVITSIYLNCRPELRDEWLAGQDQENELDDALPQEYALRSLIQFYNKRNYGGHVASMPSPEPGHKRSNSTAAVMLEDPALQSSHHHRSSVSEHDVFPPRRTDLGMPYNPDGMIEFWLHEYEDVLLEVFGDGAEDELDGFGAVIPSAGTRPPSAAETDDPAWRRLGELMRARNGVDEDSISDSESVVSVGELGDDARLSQFGGDREGEAVNPGENTWEHMSQNTLSLLPRSPAERRRSSSSSAGSPLRPLMPPGISGVLNGHPFEDVDEEDDLDLRGPMPIERETADERERSFGAVDEVEYAYGE